MTRKLAPVYQSVST